MPDTMEPMGHPPSPRSVAFAVAIVFATGLSGCGGSSGSGSLERATGTSVATTTTVPVATSEPAPVTTATTTTAREVACPAVPATASPPAGRPRYTLNLDIHPAEGIVDGQTRVVFSPDRDTDRLVFRLWPNGPRGGGGGVRLSTGQVATTAGEALSATVENPTTLVVRPPQPMAAGQSLEVTVPWRLEIPGSYNDRVSREGDALRLGSFFPILSWEPGFGWATEPPTGQFAEASMAPVADFDVSVTLPDGYNVLASGVSDRPGHWTAAAMRDFALTVGRFDVATAVANAPNPVQVSVGVHDQPASAAAPYLRKVVRVFEDFGRRFGAYPYPAFTLSITPNLGGGIEYPGHVMQGPNTLGRTTSHEVAHQWFYALVGNDQGRDPWLDEGLATYGEDRYENKLGALKASVIPGVAAGRVGQPMTFWEQHQSAYYEGVYVQGAQAVLALGPPALVDCALRHYVAANAYRVARPADLVTAATKVFPDAPATLARFGAVA